MSARKVVFMVFIGMLVIASICDGRKVSSKKKSAALKKDKEDQSKIPQNKQFLLDLESRETDPPNFVRLLLMRLVYGIATQMGLEDRISGFLGGAFAPPNAEEADDYGGFGDIGEGFDAGDIFDF